MASIVAARGNEREGFPGYCWGCRVMPVRVSAVQHFEAERGGWQRGIRWAADHGARIITLSFSEESASEPADQNLASAIAYAAHKDILVLSSTGDAGGDGLDVSGGRQRSLRGCLN